MKVDDDGTIELTEAEVAECIMSDLRRRDLAVPGAMYYVRFRLMPKGAYVIVPGGDPLSVAVTVEPRSH